MILKRLLLSTALVLFGLVAYAQQWPKEYEAGLAAAKKRDWETVITRMSAAIKAKPTEGRERPYGAVFIAYHPFYYRGIAYFELGRVEEALSDLRKTSGPGAVTLGDKDSYISRAEQKLAQAQQPADTTTATQTTTTIARDRPTPPVDVTPTVDATVRRTAEQNVNAAQKAQAAAQQANATTFASAPYKRGTDNLIDAVTRRGSAETTEDWRAVASAADRARREFESAITAAQIASADQRTVPDRATEAAVAPVRREVRAALQAYFNGDFLTAAQRLDTLTKKQNDNAMLWAFLGAAHFYAYYLDSASNSRSHEAAVQAFRRARKLNPDLRLNENYFSSRVRNFYEKQSG